MKTEQEQIDEMVKVIKGFDICGLFERCFSTGADGENTRYITCPECFAEALYNAGYGDVSEYKAEIERLEEKCEELRNEKWNAQDDLDCYCDEMPNKIKRAQIDVLNKLRRKSWQGYQIGMYIVSTQEIDELIKEVQNGEDKG